MTFNPEVVGRKTSKSVYVDALNFLGKRGFHDWFSKLPNTGKAKFESTIDSLAQLAKQCDAGDLSVFQFEEFVMKWRDAVLKQIVASNEKQQEVKLNADH